MVKRDNSCDINVDFLQRLDASVPLLLEWYQKNARDLPWRKGKNAYYTWLSEIMLQQTRVEAVIPYFNRFIKEVPSISDLANLSEEKLLKLWEGLGYYSRAKNLKKAAEMIVKDYEGKMPDTYEELLKLPGIGEYTAGAIASIAFQKAIPAVDGNVLRVVSRLLAYEENIKTAKVKKYFQTLLQFVMPQEVSGDYNQSFMDIGSQICVANGSPRCLICPLSEICLAYQNGMSEKIPIKTTKKPRKIQDKTVLVIEWQKKVILQKRPDNGLLAGLYEFPTLEGKKTKSEILQYLADHTYKFGMMENLGSVKHIFTHIEWKMQGYLIHLQQKPEFALLVGAEEIRTKYPLPTAYMAYFEKYKDYCS
jgi:A/G-specific adenine glycosylase